MNRLRSRVGLRPETDVMTQTWVSPLLNLIAVSPAICEPAPDWGPHHHVCGFLNPLPNPVAEPLPEGLADFIAAGTPPVYFTFGSAIADNDAAYIANVVAIWRAAVERVGCRAIFQLPSNDLGQFDAGPQAFKVRRAPYARVFPACALVVHHGGAGTPQTALLAGRPSVVVAHMADQFFWGSELQRLGVAGRLLKRTGMTPKRLAKAIATVWASRRWQGAPPCCAMRWLPRTVCAARWRGSRRSRSGLSRATAFAAEAAAPGGSAHPRA